MTRRRRAALVLVLAALAVGLPPARAAPAVAQTIADVELAGARIHPQFGIPVSAGLLAAQLGYADASWFVGGAGAVARLAGDRWASAGNGVVGGRLPLWPGGTVQADVSGGHGTYPGFRASTYLRGAVTLEQEAGAARFGVRGAHARQWAAGVHTGTLGFGAFVDSRLGPFQVGLGGDALRRAPLGPPTSASTTSRWIADVAASLRWECRRCTATLRLGRRVLGVGDRPRWGSADLAWWLTDRLAVVAGGGWFPADFERGASSGSAVRFGARVRLGSGGPPGRSAVPVPSAVQVVRLDDGTARLEVRAPGVERLLVRGDFSGWQPIALARHDASRWRSPPLALMPGVLRLQMSVDGTVWTPIPGTSRAPSEFAGETSVLLVPD